MLEIIQSVVLRFCLLETFQKLQLTVLLIFHESFIAEFVILNKSLKHPDVELPLVIKFSNSKFISLSFHTK